MTCTRDLFHAYILVGPVKETKREAINIAKIANCLQRNGDFCNTCKNCKKIDRGVFADLREVKPEGSSVKIENIREIIFDSYLTPVEGRKKIYIVYDADKMTLEAQNSLLKTLEEPPSESIFLLLSQNIKNLIPTVVSRCSVIEKIKPYEKCDISQEWAEKLIYLVKERSFSLEKIDIYNQICAYEDKETLLEFLLTLYRDMLVAKTNSKVRFMNENYRNLIINLSDLYSIGELIGIIDRINKTIEYIKSRGNENLVFFNLLLALGR